MILGRQIQAFHAVMRTGAMTSAADVLCVTQPAVSRLIRDLENTIGFALFERRGNMVTPTALAYELLKEVDRSFIGLERIAAFAAELRTGRAGVLTVAAMPAMSAGFVPRIVAQFLQHRPGQRVVLDGLPSNLILDGVVNGTIDVGVVTSPFSRASVSATNVNDAAVIVMPPEHRLAAKPRIQAADLEGETIITLTKFTGARHPIELALQSVPTHRAIETPLATIACVLAREGAGLAIVDPFSASEYLGPRLVSRRFHPQAAVGSAVIHSSERDLSPAAQAFHDYLLDRMRDFLGEHPAAP